LRGARFKVHRGRKDAQIARHQLDPPDYDIPLPAVAQGVMNSHVQVSCVCQSTPLDTIANAQFGTIFAFTVVIVVIHPG
jgi:hypothetical protein